MLINQSEERIRDKNDRFKTVTEKLNLFEVVGGKIWLKEEIMINPSFDFSTPGEIQQPHQN